MAATRVAPLEALRPRDEVTAGSRGGRVRTAIELMLALGGTALMLWGVSTREPASAPPSLAVIWASAGAVVSAAASR